MQIKKLIEKLQGIEKEYGNIEVFTNGEYGDEQMIKLGDEDIMVGEPIMVLSEDLAKILPEDQIVVSIGGY